eukprot:10873800-Karenia_brevis.AAC.1
MLFEISAHTAVLTFKTVTGADPDHTDSVVGRSILATESVPIQERMGQGQAETAANKATSNHTP